MTASGQPVRVRPADLGPPYAGKVLRRLESEQVWLERALPHIDVEGGGEGGTPVPPPVPPPPSIPPSPEVFPDRPGPGVAPLSPLGVKPLGIG
jgi:hypothetical protein